MEIKNSVILITGAAQRVGRIVATELAGRGAHIAFSYYSDDEPWQAARDEIAAHGVRVYAQKADVTVAASIASLVRNAHSEFGRIDVLINNASIWLKKPVLEITEAEWDMEIDVNVKGPFLVSQAVAPLMLQQQSGLIINITDLSAFQTWTGYAHHAASKAALVALTKSLALELSPHVRVNAVAPGTVLLPDNADAQKTQWAIDKSVLKRIGSPLDVARTISYLIEEDFATGGVYFVDGGRSLV